MLAPTRIRFRIDLILVRTALLCVVSAELTPLGRNDAGAVCTRRPFPN